MELRELALIAYQDQQAEIAEREGEYRQERIRRGQKACMYALAHDPDTNDGDRLTIGDITLAWDGYELRLVGICPKCGAECTDHRNIHSLEKLGEALTTFQPDTMDHECSPDKDGEQSWAQCLVALLDERYECRYEPF